MLRAYVVRHDDFAAVALGRYPGDALKALVVARHVDVRVRGVVRPDPAEQVPFHVAARLSDPFERTAFKDRPVEVAHDRMRQVGRGPIQDIDDLKWRRLGPGRDV